MRSARRSGRCPRSRTTRRCCKGRCGTGVTTEPFGLSKFSCLAGVLLATGGLDRGTHVAASGGAITLTDGPFAESKEVIVSFALIEVRTRDEAVELARRFWKIVGEGEGDIRQVLGPEG